jgi:hypothetical protein
MHYQSAYAAGLGCDRHCMQECLMLRLFNPSASALSPSCLATKLHLLFSPFPLPRLIPTLLQTHRVHAVTPLGVVMAELQHISGNFYDRLTIAGDSRVVAGNVHGDVHFNAVTPEGALPDP